MGEESWSGAGWRAELRWIELGGIELAGRGMNNE